MISNGIDLRQMTLRQQVVVDEAQSQPQDLAIERRHYLGEKIRLWKHHKHRMVKRRQVAKVKIAT